MYKIHASIHGLSDLSFNQPPKELSPAGGRPTQAERDQEVEERIYKNSHGVFIPRRWIKKTLLEGCTMANLKARGNRGLYPYLDGGVIVLEDEINITRDDKTITGYDYIYERWGRIPPKTGALAKIRTPAILSAANGRQGTEIGVPAIIIDASEWNAAFTFLVGDDALNADDVKVAISTGGAMKGMGNSRPEYGRFEVAQWEVEK